MVMSNCSASTVTCDVSVAESVRFQVVVGRDEVDGHTGFGVDPISRALACGHDLPNQSLMALMVKMTSPNDLVVDVGAHVGMFTLTAAASGRRVLAIEASRRNYGMLEKSVVLNGFSNRIRLVHAAASNCPGQLSFEERGPFGGVAEAGMPGASVVSAICVGDLLAETEGPLGFVKMDIEGFEVEAIEGLADWLINSKDSPPILYESHLLAQLDRGRSVSYLRQAFARMGYSHHYAIHDDGQFVPMALDEAQPVIVGECLATRLPIVPPRGWSVVKPMSSRKFGHLFFQCFMDYQTREFEPVLAGFGRAIQTMNSPHLEHPLVKACCVSAAHHSSAEVRTAFAPWKNQACPMSFPFARAEYMVMNGFPKLLSFPGRALRFLKRSRRAA
ncbi:MAG: FkbM family methyltransferase [Gemmataceae bacterium]